MLRIRKVSEMFGKNVYTDQGDYVGQVEEVNLSGNKVDGWKIRISGNISTAMGGARGIIAPHSFVRSIGDIFILSKAALPMKDEQEDLEKEPVQIEESETNAY
jgi:sporulation protein YlmC with PRC-barrel domain